MLSDGLTAAIDKGDAREEVEVLDVAQMLLASVKGELATRRAPGSGGVALKERPEETRAEPEPGDDTQTEDTLTETSEVGPAAKSSGGSSLFDTPADDAAEEADEPAKPAASGGSLFDLGDDDAEPEAKAEPEPEDAKPAEPKAEVPSGGSLFDIEAEDGAGQAGRARRDHRRRGTRRAQPPTSGRAAPCSTSRHPR